MSDFTRSLEGWDQLAWLVLSFNQSVTQAIQTMIDHNQDMGFVDHPETGIRGTKPGSRNTTDMKCRVTLLRLEAGKGNPNDDCPCPHHV